MRSRCVGSFESRGGRAHRHLNAAAALLVVLAAACATPREPQRHEVAMAAFAFDPDTLRVSVGDTIVWHNRDVVPHTATSSDGAWDSGAIAAQGSWSFVAETAGESEYVCTLHPSMTGVLVVQ